MLMVTWRGAHKAKANTRRDLVSFDVALCSHGPTGSRAQGKIIQDSRMGSGKASVAEAFTYRHSESGRWLSDVRCQASACNDVELWAFRGSEKRLGEVSLRARRRSFTSHDAPRSTRPHARPAHQHRRRLSNVDSQPRPRRLSCEEAQRLCLQTRTIRVFLSLCGRLEILEPCQYAQYMARFETSILIAMFCRVSSPNSHRDPCSSSP
jgi:hypothetical protein